MRLRNHEEISVPAKKALVREVREETGGMVVVRLWSFVGRPGELKWLAV